MDWGLTDFCNKTTFWDALIFLDYRHFGDYEAGSALGGYAGTCHSGGRNVRFWGIGRFKDTMSFAAYGLNHGLGLRLTGSKEGKSLTQVFMKKVTIYEYLGHAEGWRRDGGINSKNDVPEAYDEWLKLLKRKEAGNFYLAGRKGDRTFSSELEPAKAELLRLSKIAATDCNSGGIGMYPAFVGND